jgi:hypothetical protein
MNREQMKVLVTECGTEKRSSTTPMIAVLAARGAVCGLRADDR